MNTNEFLTLLPYQRDEIIACQIMNTPKIEGTFVQRVDKDTKEITVGTEWYYPLYTTDIKEVWEVIGKMQDMSWGLVLDNMEDYLGNWQAHFEKERRVFTAESEVPSLAICIAALKAVGYLKD